jgi:hypothetical protein
MSSQWADYTISAVRYNSQHTHIDQLEVRKDSGDSLGVANVWLRQDVISSIKSGKTFVTVLKNRDGTWRKGDNVSIVRVNGVEYLRTDGNSRASDNLGELPEF